jgi:hypothetical protein
LVRNHNLNAAGGSEECGACIMLEVHFLFHSRLDILETLAEALHRCAFLRTRLSQAETRLLTYEPNRVMSES